MPELLTRTTSGGVDVALGVDVTYRVLLILASMLSSNCSNPIPSNTPFEVGIGSSPSPVLGSAYSQGRLISLNLRRPRVQAFCTDLSKVFRPHLVNVDLGRLDAAGV